jgi:hypothetical protein
MTASPAHPSSIRGQLIFALVLLLVQACDSGDTREGDTSLAGDTPGEPSGDASDSQDAECDRFCIFDRWIDALRSSTYVGCVCQTTMLVITRIEQTTIDGCLTNEQQVLSSPRDFVESDCVEALTDEQLEDLVEYTACYFEQIERVSPCLRSMQAGDLCSTCEQFSNPDQRFPCSAQPSLTDRVASCADGIPGFL